MKVLLTLLLAIALASAELAPLLTVREKISGQYIVKLKDGNKLEEALGKISGAKIIHKYSKVFTGFSARLTDRMVQYLRTSDAVEYIEEDGIVQTNTVASWGLDRIDQLTLPLDDEYIPVLGDGAGVEVFVIDTGINKEHVDFGGRSSYGFDAIGTGPADCNGHGSHCAGTCVGTQYGVAKAATVIGVRVLGCFGSGSNSGVVAGCDWVAENATLPAVASMSLGGGASQATDDAIQNMFDQGITVVVAAGNSDADACNTSPARSQHAITVGATDDTDTRASFSNYGYCLDIFAPGVAITSAWIGSPDATNTISGTSMACPHVSGASAVLLGAEPTLTPAEIKESLQLKSIADAVHDPEVGSPNLLLYIGEGSGGGTVPPPPPTPTPTPGCGGEFTEMSGNFTSPKYPESYPNGVTCDYLFDYTSAFDTVVKVDFKEFSLESQTTCNYDSLEIYDGSSTSAPLTGVYCGTNSPGIQTSSGTNMFMRFDTDGSVQNTGFFATYQVLEMGGCGHTFTFTQGELTSPNYPDNYGNTANCGYLIEALQGQTITLSFQDFDVEGHVSCAYDSVEVFDGKSEMADRLAEYCGSTIPPPVTSTSNMMFVRFHSDSSMNTRGFSGSYIAQ